jgi:hypothetical protein
MEVWTLNLCSLRVMSMLRDVKGSELQTTFALLYRADWGCEQGCTPQGCLLSSLLKKLGVGPAKESGAPTFTFPGAAPTPEQE